MDTNIEVSTANCPHCLNTARDALLSDPLIHQVTVDGARGCWHVNHDYDDPQVIGGLLHRSLRGWEVAGNGEVVMFAPTPRFPQECPQHPGGDALM